MIDIIAGTFFICDAPITSETFQSLSDEQIKKYDKMFRDPERFYRVGDEIKVQKIKSSRGDGEVSFRLLLLKTWFNRARFQAGRRDEEQYVLYPLVRGNP